MALRVRDLVVETAAGRRLLSVPRLDVEAGAFVCIAGPSGAGKSTLLFALAGLAERARGRVCWDDADVLAMSERERAAFRRERVGIVFQDFLLFDELGALANAALVGHWRGREARRAIEERARRLLAGFGLDPADGRAVERFSGGERQRVALARALAGGPRAVLADEPTASLDRAAAERAIGSLRETVAAEGRTLLVVSHDPSLQRAADRLVELFDGELA